MSQELAKGFSTTGIAYLEHLKSERGYSLKTLDAYEQDLRVLESGLADRHIDACKTQEADIRRLVAVAAKQKLSPKTQARRLSCWRGYFAWLAQRGEIQSNPARAVKAPRAGKRLPKALAPDQAMSLVNFRADAVFESKRDKAIAELLYSSGLRVSELQSLDRRYVERAAQGGEAKYVSTSWLDQAQAQVTVLGKGSKMRTVPVGSAALTALQDWLTFRDAWALQKPQLAGFDPGHQNALLISQRGQRLSVRSIQARLAELGLAHGVSSKVHPHVLRHSFASHVLQSSGDLRAVQEMLGHANISSTQIYTSLDFQRLAAVYDAAHPRAKKS